MAGSAIVSGNGIVMIPIPPGGATGEVLTKLSNEDYDFDWAAGGGGAGNLQQAYDNATAPPQITINATPDPFTVDASVAGDLFALRDSSNADLVRVGDTGAILLQLTSTTQAFGLMTMTTAQRNAIADTAGALVYDTDDGTIYQNDGTGWSIPGAGLTTLQNAYDNSAAANPMIQLATASGTFTIRDDATPLADMFAIQNNAGTDFFEVDAAEFSYGLNGNRGYAFALDSTGRESIRFLPDGRTQTTVASPGGFCIQWDSTVIANIPGGLPFGNDTAPAMIGAIGECQFDEPGNLFSSSLLFNQATIISCNGVNVGPIYTMVNQPTLRNIAAGSRTVSQANAVRSQLRVGPNTAGNITLTSHVPFFITAQVDATIGTASITTMYGIQWNAPTLTAGGTIGTYIGMRLENVPAAGITTLTGIQSAMSSGTFIDHTGTAPSEFSGGIHFGDAVPLQFGGAAFNSQDASLFWSASNTLAMFFAANSDEIRFSNAVNNQIVAAGSAAAVELALDFEGGITFGDSSTLGNQVFNFVNPAFTPGAAGEVAGVLLTQAGNYTNNGLARSRVSAWVINGFSYANSSGSVTESDTLTVGGMVTSSPGVTITDRQSLHVIAGRSRFDSAMQMETISPAALGAGDNDDWGGLLTGTANNNMRQWARVSGNATTSVITGIDATEAQDGDWFTLTNISAETILLAHQDTGSAAANRIITTNGNNFVLSENESVDIRYDATTSRWRVITPPAAVAPLSGEWQFDSTTTMADPGSGNFRNNNATVGSVTAIAISDETKPGVDASNILSGLASGDQVYLQNKEDASEFLVFDITSTTDNTTWWQLNGTVNASGSNFTDGKEFIVTFIFA